MKSDMTLKRQNGSSAVEFAIILPFFVLIVFGIVEWSLYLFNDHIITDASRRGARRGIVQASPKIPEGEIRDTVLHYTGQNLVTFGAQNTPSVTVKNLSEPTMPSPIRCVTFGDDLEVKVRYNYQFLLLPALTAGKVSPSKTITARTVMRCE
jgi:hypothetical protein